MLSASRPSSPAAQALSKLVTPDSSNSNGSNIYYISKRIQIVLVLLCFTALILYYGGAWNSLKSDFGIVQKDPMSRTPSIAPSHNQTQNSNAPSHTTPDQAHPDVPDDEENEHHKLFTLIDYAKALFSIAVIVSVSVLGGKLAEHWNQAAMLGMLLTGMLCRNTLPFLISPIPHAWTGKLWAVALASVIARAGLTLKMNVLIPSWKSSLMLGTVPVLAEWTFLSLVLFTIFSMPMMWASSIGFGVACMSPGVVVPLVLNLMDRPEWSTSRLPPILLASSGIDVLIATTGYGISMATIFGHIHPHAPGEEDSGESFLVRGAEEIFGGLFCGITMGLLCLAMLSFSVHESRAFPVLFVTSVVFMIGLKDAGFPGAASSSCIVAWGVVANIWKPDAVDYSSKQLKRVWNWMQPFLFGLIGASISFQEISVFSLIAPMVTVMLSVLVKMCVAFVSGLYVGLNRAECIFLSGLWTGKASIQAAISTSAIEMLHARGVVNGEDDIVFAHSFLLFMLVAIFVGSSFASTWVRYFGDAASPLSIPTSPLPLYSGGGTPLSNEANISGEMDSTFNFGIIPFFMAASKRESAEMAEANV